MPTSRKTRSTTSNTTAATVTVRRPDLAAWRHAVALAGGDVSRLTVAEDGTVVVQNTPRR